GNTGQLESMHQTRAGDRSGMSDRPSAGNTAAAAAAANRAPSPSHGYSGAGQPQLRGGMRAGGFGGGGFRR
ncbi:MAG TPA: hypothetical protein VN132_09390, partial [Bdellovibrio sp.]|nr:hypothetical protein [Bdellovibrio sp.]